MPDHTTCRDVKDADVVIHEFTDPGCPWAYSAEPFRRRHQLALRRPASTGAR